MARYDCTLWEFLNDNDKYDMTLPKRVDFLSEMIDVIIYVQSNGICHRDIKPSNVLLRTKLLSTVIEKGSKKQELNSKYTMVDGEWALCDFGLSCNISNLTGSNGTPCFAPMEQFDDHPHRKSDNYSLAKLAVLLLFPWKLGWNLIAAPLSSTMYKKFPLKTYLSMITGMLNVSIMHNYQNKPKNCIQSTAPIVDKDLPQKKPICPL